jgi:hypothetical protein
MRRLRHPPPADLVQREPLPVPQGQTLQVPAGTAQTESIARQELLAAFVVCRCVGSILDMRDDMNVLCSNRARLDITVPIPP